MEATKVRRDDSVLSLYPLYFPNCEKLNSASIGWRLMVGGNTAGFATGCVGSGWSWFYLNSAYVMTSYRGLGLQRRLIRVRCNFAKKLDLIPITYVHPKNHASLNNLIKCGFSFYEPAYQWAGADYLYLRKD